jgi:hypothetical protein
MSLQKLFDHRAELYRSTETNTTGDPTIAWAEVSVPDGLNARADQSWTGLLAGSPLGEQQAATRIWYLDKRFADVRERDVLDIVRGPAAPSRWRVHSVTLPTNPKVVHHVEVATRHYEGSVS